MQDNVKSLGQYFTQENVALFMCNLIDKKGITNILEPSAGEGVFLKALADINFDKKIIEAYEIDSDLKNVSETKINYENFLSSDINNKYDLIIGNPPYVRWKNIPKKMREELKDNDYWNDKINGLSDLLYAFIYKCVDLLNDNGELIFITPSFWTQTKHSNDLRRHLINNGEIDFLINFHEMRLFKEVSSNIIIFKFRKQKLKKDIKVVNLKSKKKIDDNILNTILMDILPRLVEKDYISDDMFEAYKYPQFTSISPWKTIPPHIEPIINKMEESCKLNSPLVTVKNNDVMQYSLTSLLEKRDLEDLDLNKKDFKKVNFAGNSYYFPDFKQSTLIQTKQKKISRYIRLGDVVEIGNGMVSGLDKAFKTSENENFSQKEKLISVVKAADLKQYSNKKDTKYIFVNDVETVQKLTKEYPKIHDHLIQFKENLEKRYNYGRDIPWWHWVFLRNKGLMESSDEKIFVPCKERTDKREHIRFAYVTGNTYATQDVSVIVKKKEFNEDLKYLLALLNSEIIYNWIKYKGLSRGGVFEFSERPLSNIPIRLIDWENEYEIRLHDKIISLVNELINNQNNDNMEIKKEIERYVEELYLGISF